MRVEKKGKGRGRRKGNKTGSSVKSICQESGWEVTVGECYVERKGKEVKVTIRGEKKGSY